MWVVRLEEDCLPGLQGDVVKEESAEEANIPGEGGRETRDEGCEGWAAVWAAEGLWGGGGGGGELGREGVG